MGSVSTVIKGLEWAVQDAQQRGVESKAAINMSIASDYSRALNKTVKAAVQRGLTVIAAAGNSGVCYQRFIHLLRVPVRGV